MTRQQFDIESWRVIVEQCPDGRLVAEATVKLIHRGQRIVATAEGNGTLNALDNALRMALHELNLERTDVELADSMVRFVDTAESFCAGTALSASG